MCSWRAAGLARDSRKKPLRSVELQSVSNVRDLGGVPVCGGREVSPGLIYRGSALCGLTPHDADAFFAQRGIALVVDLRCGWERAAKPDVSMPGVENMHVPFYDLEKVGIEYTEPAAGTKVVGRDVACVPVNFYRSLANPLTVGQMCEAARLVFDSVLAGRPVYLHCSGGKDRAGVMALLVLTVLGASRQDILEDYLLTNVSRDKHYQKEFERFLRFANGDERRAHELTRAHAARPENLEAFYGAIDEHYGDMESFVREKLGIGAARQEQIRACCTRLRSID